MPVIIDARTAQRQISKLLDRVRAGEEIIISVDGKPYARMIPPETGTVSPASQKLR